jgi:hypothetical protein
LALLLTVELISRVPVHRRSLAAVRLTATAFIAAIAAYVSYRHMVGVAVRYGEQGAAPFLIPLSVDGLIVVASVCLVELAGRLRIVEQADMSPVTAADTTPDTEPDSAPQPVSENKPEPARTPRRTARPTTAAAVARLHDRHPEMSTADIARRLGVTDRTVRRHLNRPVTV